MDSKYSHKKHAMEHTGNDSTNKDENNVIGKFLQNLQQHKIQEHNVPTDKAANDEDAGAAPPVKYNPYQQDEDEDDKVFGTENRVPIPVLSLDLDYKPKNIKFAYSLNEAYKIQNLAVTNSELMMKMKEQLPDVEFFRLTATPVSRRHGPEGYKSAGQNKRKDKKRNNSNVKARTQKKVDSNSAAESSLEEKVELMKLEQEISSTGNKMQDFELFKQMMRKGGGGVKTEESLEHNNGSESVSKNKKTGLTGMFALSDFDKDSFQELEPETRNGGHSEETSSEKKSETKKGSKYAMFLKESMGETDSLHVAEQTNNASAAESNRSKLMGFFSQQQEGLKKQPASLPSQPFLPNGTFPPFDPNTQQAHPALKNEFPSFNPMMMPPPPFYQQSQQQQNPQQHNLQQQPEQRLQQQHMQQQHLQQQHMQQQHMQHPHLQQQQQQHLQQQNLQQLPGKNFNPMMPPPQFFQQQHQKNPGNFPQQMGMPPGHMMGMPPMPPQFMMLTPQQQQQFFLQQQKMANNQQQK